MSPRRKDRPGSATKTSRGTTPTVRSPIIAGLPDVRVDAQYAPAAVLARGRSGKGAVWQGGGAGKGASLARGAASGRVGGLAQGAHGAAGGIGLALREAALDRRLRPLPVRDRGGERRLAGRRQAVAEA